MRLVTVRTFVDKLSYLNYAFNTGWKMNKVSDEGDQRGL